MPPPSPTALPSPADFERTFAPIVGTRAARDGHAALAQSPGTPQQRIEAAARWLQPHRRLTWRWSSDLRHVVLVLPDARFLRTLAYRPTTDDIAICAAVPAGEGDRV